jgi:hypothetical protein
VLEIEACALVGNNADVKLKISDFHYGHNRSEISIPRLILLKAIGVFCGEGS